MSLSMEGAAKVTALLKLKSEVIDALTTVATKGEGAPTTPKEPTQYRLHEIIYVYGRMTKELIDEKFGPGIVSAIDFTVTVDKQPDPKGDRVVITMNGKFQSYKKGK